VSCSFSDLALAGDARAAQVCLRETQNGAIVDAVIGRRKWLATQVSTSIGAKSLSWRNFLLPKAEL
jgi:hypothetical protein